MRLNALFRLAFATATPHGLTLPHIVTRRLILQKARGHFTPVETGTLPRLVGTRFQVLFHDPSPGCFSPFPHGTCSLSVAKEYLALGDGPPDFPQGSTCPVVLRIRTEKGGSFRLRGSHPLWRAFPGASSTNVLDNSPGYPSLPPTHPYDPPYATPTGFKHI